MPKQAKPDEPKRQVQKFREAARDLECDESEDRFKDALKAIAKRSSVQGDRKA